jgi:hypothetical protein
VRERRERGREVVGEREGPLGLQVATPSRRLGAMTCERKEGGWERARGLFAHQVQSDALTLVTRC